jgi:hypothetical protein
MDGYQGWKNYPTWAVALWFDNEEGSYNERVLAGDEAWEQAKENRAYSSESRKDAAVRLLADWLEDELEEATPDLGCSMFSDLLGFALQAVDCYEIAQHWIEEVDREEEEDGARAGAAAEGQ